MLIKNKLIIYGPVPVKSDWTHTVSSALMKCYFSHLLTLTNQLTIAALLADDYNSSLATL